MADQRPAFSFRLPWLPAAQPPRPSFPPRPPTQPTATTTPAPPTPQTAPTQVPTQPISTTTSTSATAQTQVPAQSRPTTTSVPTTQTAEQEAIPQPTITTPTTAPQTAEIQNPTQQPTVTTAIPTAERPPFRPPAVAPAEAPPPQSQTSRTESQPPSPSRATSQPQVPSQPVSPSRAATLSQAPAQPSTPPPAAPQPRAVSLPSSPSQGSPQVPSTTQTATQPRSPSLLASRPSGQTSSPPSPSGTTVKGQLTTETVNLPTSPEKTEQSITRKSPQPSANSTEVISSLLDKPEPKSAVTETPSLEIQPKKETTSASDYDSQNRAPAETGNQPDEIIQQPPKGPGMKAAKQFPPSEGPETNVLKHTSNSSMVNGEPESFPKELKPEETKEVKEVVQETKDKAHDEDSHKDANLTGEMGQTLHTKDPSSIGFQSIKAEKPVGTKELTATSASNGKQTKITAQTRNKTMVGDTRQKLAMANGEHIPLHKEIRDDISKLVQKMAAGDSKHSIDDRPVSVITLAGENRGASMHIGSDSSRKEGAVHIHRGYKINPDESAEATTDGEESIKGKSNAKPKEDQASESFINSNIQGINNSILFNGSITESNPGVHLSHSHFPTESKKPQGKPEPLETRKAEFNVTPSQKLTHEPTVRRRCLRGLFLESSDSDVDSTKPRRHGCRVGCNKKSKEKNIDVL